MTVCSLVGQPIPANGLLRSCLVVCAADAIVVVVVVVATTSTECAAAAVLELEYVLRVAFARARAHTAIDGADNRRRRRATCTCIDYICALVSRRTCAARHHARAQVECEYRANCRCFDAVFYTRYNDVLQCTQVV